MKIQLSIPATTANLGPGFDCMGLALDLWNTFELEIGDFAPELFIEGEGAERLSKGDDNLVLATFRSELEAEDLPQPTGWRMAIRNGVPVASGLGSSSTATLAGVLFAEGVRLAVRGIPSPDFDRVLERAVRIEGHGDNVAPALLGGLILVVPDGERVIARRLPCANWKAVVCVPRYDFLTTEARKLLPDTYSKADAIFNIGHSLMVSLALAEGDSDLLARSLRDRIHEPYRLPNIPGGLAAIDAAKQAGAIGACLSGAGPGIVAFSRSNFEAIGEAMVAAFASSGLVARYWAIDVSPVGAKFDLHR